MHGSYQHSPVTAQVRAPTRPHPEAPNLPPFNETTYAAAKQVDTALDQARMPTVVPTVVSVTCAPAGDTGAGGAGGADASAGRETAGGAGGGADAGKGQQQATGKGERATDTAPAGDLSVDSGA